MTRNEEIEIMAAELAKSEQMTLADCRRWIERCVAAREHTRFLAVVDEWQSRAQAASAPEAA